ncbi:MAG: hypothetical protein LBI04_03620 [Treponema sp.]|jgi:hypothetical protein|nr:hypothetical protein [Treponema sp.]
MAKGQSFLNVPDKTARGEIRHLNVVITEPDDDNNVLVVPVCTYREKDGKPFPGQDDSCLLRTGCHPFIKERSYIKYSNALAMSLIDIFNGLKKGKLIKKSDFDNSFVQDMQRGAEESIFLPEKLKRFFEYFV